MGVKVVWDNDEQTILRVEFAGLWTWDDFCVVANHGLDLIQQADHRIGLIACYHQGDTMLPTGLFRRDCRGRCLKKNLDVLLQAVVAVAVVGRSPGVEMMIASFCRIYQQIRPDVFEVASIEDAHTLLYQKLNGNHAQTL
jgi:hypothetical protein